MPLAETLALLAADAYEMNPAKDLPAGFTAVDAPGLRMHNGLYASDGAQAVLSTGQLGSDTVYVLAFRGSDNHQDWLDDVRNINAEYSSFQPLIAAVEGLAAQGQKIVVVGHSLGGAMAQLFMETHGGAQYRAVTFGSPGALLDSTTPDPRITNIVTADDPLVFLGTHRIEVAQQAASDPAYAAALTAELSQLTHLPTKALVDSLPYMTSDYANLGAVVEVGAGQPLTVQTLLTADPQEHDIATYENLLAGASFFGASLW